MVQGCTVHKATSYVVSQGSSEWMLTQAVRTERTEPLVLTQIGGDFKNFLEDVHCEKAMHGSQEIFCTKTSLPFNWIFHESLEVSLCPCFHGTKRERVTRKGSQPSSYQRMTLEY